MQLLQKALEFATVAHNGQVRKYTGEPYVNHCIEVVEILKQHGVTDEATLCAAMLHDTVEDTEVTFQQIKNEFGHYVMRLVFFVTDVVEKEQGNRATRIDLNTHHITGTRYPSSLLIKCADVISNTASIVERDPGFAPQYLKEKQALLEAMENFYPPITEHKIFETALLSVTQPTNN